MDDQQLLQQLVGEPGDHNTEINKTTNLLHDISFCNNLCKGLAEKVLYNNFLKERNKNEEENALEEDFSQFMYDVFQI